MTPRKPVTTLGFVEELCRYSSLTYMLLPCIQPENSVFFSPFDFKKQRRRITNWYRIVKISTVIIIKIIVSVIMPYSTK